jgi:hypothetical protein
MKFKVSTPSLALQPLFPCIVLLNRVLPVLTTLEVLAMVFSVYL